MLTLIDTPFTRELAGSSQVSCSSSTFIEPILIKVWVQHKENRISHYLLFPRTLYARQVFGVHFTERWRGCGPRRVCASNARKWRIPAFQTSCQGARFVVKNRGNRIGNHIWWRLGSVSCCHSLKFWIFRYFGRSWSCILSWSCSWPSKQKLLIWFGTDMFLLILANVGTFRKLLRNNNLTSLINYFVNTFYIADVYADVKWWRGIKRIFRMVIEYFYPF